MYDHQVVFLVGDYESAKNYIQNKIGNLENCAFTELEYEKFGIQEAEGLRQIDSMKSDSLFEVYAIKISNVPMVAFDTLLKTFEEPKEGVTYYICMETVPYIPETILSRVDVVRVGDILDTETAKAWLKMGVKDREAYIKDEIMDEDLSHAEKVKRARSLIVSLAKIYRNENDFEKLKKAAYAEKLLSQAETYPKSVLMHLILEL